MKISILVAATVLIPTAASATKIQGAGSLPNAQALVIPALNYVGTGPVHFGNATWSSNYPDSLFGSTTPFTYDNDTAGSPGEPIIRIDRDHEADYVTMTVTFDQPVKGVLAKLYWNDSAASPFGANSGSSTVFAAYDSSGHETVDPGCHNGNNHTPYCQWVLNDNGANPNRYGEYFPDSPGYFGYSFATPVIKTVTFSDRYIGASQLYYAPGVAEPATWAMLIAGFGIIGLRQRRHQRVAAG